MQMDQQKWGKLASAMRNIQSRLRNLDVHAVFTSLAKVDQDAAGNAVGSPIRISSASRRSRVPAGARPRRSEWPAA